MKSKVDFRNVMVIAGSYVATLIGSGYATGQEIMQFFVYYGAGGILVSIIVMTIFSLLAMECLERGRKIQPAESMKMFQFYAGKYLGTFFEWFTLLFLFGVTVVMISGAGDTLSEYYHLNGYVGRILVAVTMYLTVSLGLVRLAHVLGNIGPIIIFFTIIVGVITIFSGDLSNIKEGMQFMSTADVAKPVPNALVAGINYASYNVIVVIAFLAGLGRDTNSRRETFLSGVLGGGALGFTALVMYLAILSHADQLYDKQIPTLFLADAIHPIFGALFSVILLLGIYTTAVTLTFQVSDRFTPDGSPHFKLTAFIVSALALACGFIPFDVLVSTIYPFAGYVGIALLVLMAIKFVKLKRANSDGAEEMRAIEEDFSIVGKERGLHHVEEQAN